MSRYFFDLTSGAEEMLDPEGTEMAAGAVAAATLQAARCCMAGDVQDGHVDLNDHIDVHEEGREPIHSLSFADAAEIIPVRPKNLPETGA